MDLQLRGKRALVTGSSSGIGASIAAALAAEGASVIVHGRDVSRVQAVATSIGENGGTAATVVGDLTDDDTAAAVAQAAIEAFGGVDILVNNAGGRDPSGGEGLWDTSLDEWVRTYNLNVLASVRMVKALVPAMISRGWGRVINISSLAGRTVAGDLADYAAAKAAINNLTMGMVKALARTGVTANTISPGMIKTANMERYLDIIATREGLEDSRAAEAWVFDNTIPQTVARTGAPEDIGHAVAFLASPCSDFISGTNLRVDGGSALSVS